MSMVYQCNKQFRSLLRPITCYHSNLLTWMNLVLHQLDLNATDIFYPRSLDMMLDLLSRGKRFKLIFYIYNLAPIRILKSAIEPFPAAPSLSIMTTFASTKVHVYNLHKICHKQTFSAFTLEQGGREVWRLLI